MEDDDFFDVLGELPSATATANIMDVSLADMKMLTAELKPKMPPRVQELVEKSISLLGATPDKYVSVSVWEAIDSVVKEALICLAELSANEDVSTADCQKLEKLRSLIKVRGATVLIVLIENIRALNDKEATVVIFGDEITSAESVEKRRRRLAFYFHPDKAVKRYALLSSQGEILDDFMKFINDLTSFLHKKMVTIFATKEALKSATDEFREKMQIATDFHHALQGNFEKMKIVKPESFQSSSKEALEAEMQKAYLDAYKSCRAACRLADELKSIDEQVALRQHMSLCLLKAGRWLDAQVYAIAACRLVLHLKARSPDLARDIQKAKSILAEVRERATEASLSDGVQPNFVTPDPVATSRSHVPELPETRLIIHPRCLDTSFSSDQDHIERMKVSVQEDMDKLSRQLIFRADKSLMSLNVSVEDMIRSKESVQVQSALAFTGGVLAVSGAASGAAVGIFVGVELTPFVVPAIVVGGGLAAALGVGIGLIFAGWYFYKKSKDLRETIIAKERINAKMQEMVSAWDKEDYAKVFDLASDEYEPGKHLINKKPGQMAVFDPGAIDDMVKMDFRPDGIAFFFIVVAEALASGDVKIEGYSQEDLTNQAISILKAIDADDSVLTTEAKKLDKRVSELRAEAGRGVDDVSWWTNLLNFKKQGRVYYEQLWELRNRQGMARDQVEGAEEMPFKARLEEIRNIGRLNKALIRIIKMRMEDDNLADACKDVHKVRNAIEETGAFVSKAHLRLEVIEDFLWVISGKSVVQPMPTAAPQMPALADSIDFVNAINARIDSCRDDSKQSADLYCEKAEYLENRATQQADAFRMMQDCQQAEGTYLESFRLSDYSHVRAVLGYLRCLVKLHKDIAANQVFRKYIRLVKEEAEAWLLQATIFRRWGQYLNAKDCLAECVVHQGGSLPYFARERIILNQLMVGFPTKRVQAADECELLAKRMNARIQEYRNSTVNCDKDYFKRLDNLDFNRRLTERVPFNILSVDGGGIRGIIPAIGLAEVEKRAQRPISHLFHLGAGTSTGALVVSSLLMPKQVGSGRSQFEPGFRACDIVELYTTRGPEIFQQNDSWWDVFGLHRASYNAEGRLAVLKSLSGNVRLKDMMSDVLISAVKESSPERTFLFSRHKARKDYKAHDYALVDALMASTAAPSFFPAHGIGQDLFLDGGVQANSLALEAYTHSRAANPGLEARDIFCLSLGTGSFYSDPLNPEKDRGKLFWAQNFHKIALAAQENGVDNIMRGNLGSRFQRWQVGLPKPIGLDSIDADSLVLLSELAHQMIEEMDASDENPLNRTVEYLLDNNRQV